MSECLFLMPALQNNYHFSHCLFRSANSSSSSFRLSSMIHTLSSSDLSVSEFLSCIFVTVCTVQSIMTYLLGLHFPLIFRKGRKRSSSSITAGIVNVNNSLELLFASYHSMVLNPALRKDCYIDLISSIELTHLIEG